MNDFSVTLAAYAAAHPAAALQDLCKLAFQAACGGGHLLQDEAAAKARFYAEWETALPRPRAAVFLPLSARFARLDLAQAKLAGWPAELCWRMFRESAALVPDKAALAENAARVTEFCESGRFAAADGAAARAAWARWEQADKPLFSHSEGYRAAYLPTYRVVNAAYLPLSALLLPLWKLSQGGCAAVAIEGRCGSGKTTLADLCAPLFDAEIIRMDDFFLPPALRCEARYAEPGGNVDYERFGRQVLPFLHGGTLCYDVFSCRQGGFVGQRTLTPAPLVLVEGSYSTHPSFGRPYDLTVFCDVDPAVQKARILARSGEAMWQNFEHKWIPMEEAYFSTFGVKERCDMVLWPGQTGAEDETP